VLARGCGWRLLVVVFLVVGVCVCVDVARAGAVGVPAWGVDSFASPSVFSTADNAGCLATSQKLERCDTFRVTVTNVGAAQMASGAVTISDALPAGLTVRQIVLRPNRGIADLVGEHIATCTTAPVKCVIPASYFSLAATLDPAGAGRLFPDETLEMFIVVTVDEPAALGVLVNTASVSGGGAAEASGGSETPVQAGPAVFGLSGFSSPFVGVEGVVDTQAGGHPYELQTRLDLSNVVREDAEGSIGPTAVQDLRDVVVDLPLGLAASALAVPTCTLAQLSSKGEAGISGISACPTDTIVGHIRTYPEGFVAANSYIYNIVPERGVAAELGFIDLSGGSHVLDASLAPTPSGYVLRSTSREVPQAQISKVAVEVYGDPAARDRAIQAASEAAKAGKHAYAYSPVAGDVPMFTNPEDCSGEPLRTMIYMDSWQAPGSYNADGTPDLEDPRWARAEYVSLPVTGCEALEGLFKPEITAATETAQADSPTGIQVNVKVPQSESAETLATPPVKDTTVTLPEGMTVNPSSANGLQACSLAQVGVSATGVPNAAAPACPDASKIGEIELESPAVPSETCKQPGEGLSECPNGSEREKTPLLGSVYLARQSENPFGSLIAAYIVVDDPRTGVLAKIPAEVQLNEQTGQITTIVPNTPQLPFSELRTHIFGGATASLATPPACGAYTVSSQLTPWSAPQSGPPASASSSFEVTQAAGGGSCPATTPFAPSFTAGTQTAQAGAYTPFSLSFSRGDSEQPFAGVSITTPQGLLASLANVSLCPEPQASKGECGPESLVGEVSAAAGVGPTPYWVHGGKAYITGPYNGGPFGLSMVIPTTAGPFTLTGNAGFGKELVRASIRVNPTTAQITAVSDPLPTIIQGIQLHIRTVQATINRPGFMFNPTNCSPLAVTATLTGTQGASIERSTPFYTANCKALAFKPKLTATVAGQGSKTNGTRFAVTLESPGLGQTTIHKVDLTIPAKLPSRLTTIQKACLEKVFNTNPAACDEGSQIGEAIVHTPLFKNPLRGPAYLVSHGGAAFPDVEIVLQGEGVTIILDGKTDIKHGITYSRFDTAPDAPFTRFETIFPAGPHSALTPNVPEKENFNLCKTTLTLPTELTASNGAEIKTTTPVTITGCKLTITSHKTNTHTHTLTLTLNIPGPGKLHITGNHIHPTTTTTTHQTTQTIKLHITTHHKTTLHIKLTYTPTAGPKQTKTLNTQT
jgi:hypothetical protein